MAEHRAVVHEILRRSPQDDKGAAFVVREPIGLAPALLATLAYHDLMELPLTAVASWRYLMAPRGSGQEVGGRRSAPTLRDVEAALGALVATGRIETRNGFYFLPGRGRLFETWIERHARSQEKWKRLRRIVFWLQWIPFLRGVAGTGSLAFDTARASSDLDALVIAAPGRVWTVRFFLTVLLDLFRLRRRPRGPTRDRVCLNHYLSEDALAFPYRSLYTALEYARLVPLLGQDVCRAFRAANRSWMEEHLVRVFPDTLPHLKTVRTSRALRVAQRAGEGVLGGRVGDLLERLLARAQRARIAQGAGAPGRVVATDARAEFHPHSREAPLLRAFNARMEALGLTDAFGFQRDSGLV